MVTQVQGGVTDDVPSPVTAVQCSLFASAEGRGDKLRLATGQDIEKLQYDRNGFSRRGIPLLHG